MFDYTIPDRNFAVFENDYNIRKHAQLAKRMLNSANVINICGLDHCALYDVAVECAKKDDAMMPIIYVEYNYDVNFSIFLLNMRDFTYIPSDLSFTEGKIIEDCAKQKVQILKSTPSFFVIDCYDAVQKYLDVEQWVNTMDSGSKFVFMTKTALKNIQTMYVPPLKKNAGLFEMLKSLDFNETQVLRYLCLCFGNVDSDFFSELLTVAERHALSSLVEKRLLRKDTSILKMNPIVELNLKKVGQPFSVYGFMNKVWKFFLSEPQISPQLLGVIANIYEKSPYFGNGIHSFRAGIIQRERGHLSAALAHFEEAICRLNEDISEEAIFLSAIYALVNNQMMKLPENDELQLRDVLSKLA